MTLCALCVALLPILITRDFTPANELRYLSIADEALRDHTLFAFTNHGVPYADKPPLWLWAVMLLRLVTGGHHMWLLALLSLLPAIGVARVMDSWTEREVDGRYRSLAMAMLLTCGIFLGASIFVRMDMLMCFFIVLSLRQFWKVWTGEPGAERAARLFPFTVFLAVFSKGPVGLLMPLCSTVVFALMSRRASVLARCWGWRTWGVLLACCAVWFSGVYADGGADYLYDMLVHQTVGRAVGSFHHAAPAWYYAVHLWYCLAPWSPLVVGVCVAAMRKSTVRSDLQRFFLTVSVVTLLLLSCVSAKLQVYMVPAVPFIVYSTVMFLPRFEDNPWARAALALPAIVLVLALPAMAVLTMKGWGYGPFYVAAVILTLSGLFALGALYGENRTWGSGAAIRYMAYGVLAAVFVGGMAMPRLNDQVGYGAVCAKAQELSREKGITDFRAWHVGRAENMDVYLHRPVSVITNDGNIPKATAPYLLMVRAKDLNRFKGMETYPIGKYAVVMVKN